MITLKTNTQAEIDFIVGVTIIEPLEKIVTNLENREYRDCDVSWLDEKLQHFTSMALELLNIKLKVTKGVDGIMNDSNRERFLKYFKTLYKFFKRYE